MRRERARKTGGRAGHADRELAFGVETREVVVFDFGHTQAIPGENKIRFEGWGGIDAASDVRVFPELERLGISLANAVAHEPER